MHRGIRSILSLCLIASCVPRGRAQVPDETRQLAHDIFKQLIEINTTDSVGNVTTAAEAMANRLRDAGFAEADIKLAGPNERKKNLIVRFRGTGKRTMRFFLRSFGPASLISASAKPASRKRLAIASAAVVTFPTESVVLISMSCLKMSCANCLVSSGTWARPRGTQLAIRHKDKIERIPLCIYSPQSECFTKKAVGPLRMRGGPPAHSAGISTNTMPPRTAESCQLRGPTQEMRQTRQQ